MSSFAAEREEMCLLGRSLFERGLTPGSSGNLSARLQDGSFLMTPTNASLGFLDPATLSHFSPQGTLLSGDKPTKEAFLHLAMYRGRPQIGAVTHLHSTWCVCLSCMDPANPADMVPPLTPYVRMRVGAVAYLPYHRPGDTSLGALIEDTAARHAGMIIANHGPVVAGKTLRDSVFACEELEEAAKLTVLTRNLPVNPLTPAQLAELDAISLKA